MRKPLYIVKIGGVVITDRTAKTTARHDVIERLVTEILEAQKEKGFNLVLVNGAGSFGHIPVIEYGVKEGIKDEKTRFGTVMVHKHVEDLNRMIWEKFLERSHPAVPIHPMSVVLHEEGKIKLFETRHLKELLKHGIIPLMYGDMVADSKRGSSIISGDDIVPYLARKLKASKVFIGTNTDGIFDKDPNKHSNARQIPLIDSSNIREVITYAQESAVQDVTGGMRKKLESLLEQSAECDCVIFNAAVPGMARKALSGERVGTIIKGNLKSVKQ